MPADRLYTLAELREMVNDPPWDHGLVPASALAQALDMLEEAQSRAERKATP